MKTEFYDLSQKMIAPKQFADNLYVETNLSANNIVYLGEMYTTPALIDEIIHLYLATDLVSGEQDLDEDEFIHLQKIMMSANELKEFAPYDKLIKNYS